MNARLLFVVAAVTAAASASLVAACSSDDVDNTVYLAPDSGPVTTYYCIRDLDCQIDGGSQVCGFPIDDGCAARGVCVDFLPPTGKCPTTSTYCGCDQGAVTACGVQDGYVQGGPTSGKAATAGDAASCN